MSTTSCMGNGQPQGRHLPPWSEPCLVFLSFGLIHLDPYFLRSCLRSCLWIFSQVFQLKRKFNSSDINKNEPTKREGKLWWRDVQRVPVVCKYWITPAWVSQQGTSSTFRDVVDRGFSSLKCMGKRDLSLEHYWNYGCILYNQDCSTRNLQDRYTTAMLTMQSLKEWSK